MDVEEVAWKKVSGKVFRPPDYPAIYATLLGIGAQVFVLTYLFIVTVIVVLGNKFMRPLLFLNAYIYSALTAWVNGFITAKVMKFFGSSDWCFAAMASGMTFPCYLMGTFLLVDIISWTEKSSQTVPFTSVLLYMFVWCAIAMPASFYGSYRGFLGNPTKPAVKVDALPRRIPPQPWYLDYRITVPIFGAIIFGSIFGEFQYIMNSVWHSYMYAMYGFLFFNLQLLCIVISLLSVVQTYITLNAQNYEWWWRAFWVGASGGFYMGAYSLYYMVFVLKMNFVAGELIYLLYMVLCTGGFMLMCGTISTLASYIFVHAIYSGIKGD
jgi:transmembrane 9 superfamily member 2/4